MPKKKAVGITHFPLQAEAGSQDRVPPRRTAESQPSGGKRGHRLSREQGSQGNPDADETFQGKGGKGGKSRGSRAGLLAASRKVRTRSR